MTRLDLRKILRPRDDDLSEEPSVCAAGTVTKAIEVMLENNLKRIAVTNGEKVIGMIHLEDALTKIGLLDPTGSRCERSLEGR